MDLDLGYTFEDYNGWITVDMRDLVDGLTLKTVEGMPVIEEEYYEVRTKFVPLTATLMIAPNVSCGSDLESIVGEVAERLQKKISAFLSDFTALYRSGAVNADCRVQYVGAIDPEEPKKVAAIKIIRKYINIGLKEAKDIVDCQGVIAERMPEILAIQMGEEMNKSNSIIEIKREQIKEVTCGSNNNTF